MHSYLSSRTHHDASTASLPYRHCRIRSINAAAQNLYASQSNLSTAIKELEQELGISIFTRSNRGVTLTNDGTSCWYARQVIEQANMLESRYANKEKPQARLAVSTQHYAFSVEPS